MVPNGLLEPAFKQVQDWELMISSSTSSRDFKFIGLCLAVVLISSALSSQIQSAWGKVRVTSIQLPTQNGQWLRRIFFDRLQQLVKTLPLA